MLRNDFHKSEPLPATTFRFGAASATCTRETPAEVAVNVIYAPVPYAVMMATPADLEDFAYGFSLTEGVIDNANEIRSVEVEQVDRGLRLIITLSADKTQRHLARTRNMAGRTGCGLCGIDDLSALPNARISQAQRSRLRLSSIKRALSSLPEHQPLNDATHAVHAAAWCDATGAIVAAREDVGRHNALDKLIGHLLRSPVDPATGFILITSRCSFEMVEKAAAFQAGAIVAVSAPTSLAIERAEAHGMVLMAIARNDGVQCFSGADRVIDDLTADERRTA
jgi:FdhD protein